MKKTLKRLFITFMAIYLSVSILGQNEAASQLTFDAVYPNQGSLGSTLDVNAFGSGFTTDTDAYLSLDVGNEKQILSSLNLQDPRMLVVKNDYAYVADTDQGIVIIDISVPQDLIITAIKDIIPSPKFISISDTHAYIFDEQDMLYVTELTDDLDFEIIRKTQVKDIKSIEVNEDELYVSCFDLESDSGVFKILDVSEPSEDIPVVLGQTQFLKPLATEGYCVHEEATPGIYVENNSVYLADFSFGQIVDVSDKQNPVIKRRIIDLSEWEGIIPTGGSWTNFNPTITDIAAHEGVYFCSGQIGIAAFVLSDFGTAIPKSFTSLENSYKIDIIRDEAYLPLSSGDIAICDISDPEEIEHVGGVDIVGWDSIYAEVQQNNGYVLNAASTLNSVDLKYPTAKKTINTDLLSFQFINNNVLYKGLSNIETYDISDPNNITKLDEVSILDEKPLMNQADYMNGTIFFASTNSGAPPLILCLSLG